jgi:hypothetical protein
MAYHDHCGICDYSEATGCFQLSIPLGGNGRVRRTPDGEFICDACSDSVHDVLGRFSEEDDEDHAAAYPLPEVS